MYLEKKNVNRLFIKNYLFKNMIICISTAKHTKIIEQNINVNTNNRNIKYDLRSYDDLTEKMIKLAHL